MPDDKTKEPQVNRPVQRPPQAAEPTEARKGILGRFNTRLNDALQSSRGGDRPAAPTPEPSRPAPAAAPPAEDLARRSRNVATAKMVIPEGVRIEGSISGGQECEISGRVDGDIVVEGRLFLGSSATVSGNVRAGSCRVEGLVDGKVECSDTLELGQTGRLNADVMAGRGVNLAGQVNGNVTTAGVLRLAATARLTGDVHVRTLAMEEGAALNGKCAMRPPSQRSATQTK